MSTLSFKDFLVEAEKVVYLSFGRMNPPTIGHEKMMDVLAKKAGRNPYRIYLSQSNDKKNPLQYGDKIKHLRKMFPKHARSIILNKNVKTPFDALSDLYDQGFRKVVLVAGSDRINEYDVRLNKYNGQKGSHGFYNFEGGVQVISAGERDPDGEGASGASGTKQREFATDNDFTSFAQYLPKGMSTADARKLFNDVRKGLGLKEETDFKARVQFDPISEEREQYVRGELFKAGDAVVIKENEEVGIVKQLGANYVLVDMGQGRTLRKWLTDVEKIDD